MAVAGTVVHRAVGHSVSGRKNSQMTRKRVVCLHSVASLSQVRLTRALLGSWKRCVPGFLRTSQPRGKASLESVLPPGPASFAARITRTDLLRHQDRVQGPTPARGMHNSGLGCSGGAIRPQLSRSGSSRTACMKGEWGSCRACSRPQGSGYTRQREQKLRLDFDR